MNPNRVPADLLAALLPISDRRWTDQALCAQVDPEIFFPPRGDMAFPAKRVCARCPVKAECLAEALATDDRYGVRGGLSERQRRGLRAQQRARTGGAA